MQTLYPAVVNSPGTVLAQAVSAGADVIPLVDASKVSVAPGLVTLGYAEDAETVLFTDKNLTNNTLIGCTRGFQGTARAWGANTPAGRYFTAYDFDTLISNMSEVITALSAVQAGAIMKSIVTDVSDFIVGGLVADHIVPVKKTLAEIKVILGLGSAAYASATDFGTSVQGGKADAALPATGGTMTGSLVLHADPSQSLEAATKQYVDSLLSGLKWKTSVHVATTANLTSLFGLLTLDTVELQVGDRVLVKNQTDPKGNGIYVAAESAWSRAADADTGSKLANAAVLVEQGSTQHDRAWVCTNDIIEIGVTDITFVKFAGSLERVEASTTNGNILVDGNEVTVYTHPSSHVASIITEDTTHRFVTDTEKTTWNGMIPLSVVTTEDDFIVASGNATVIRKSPADVRFILNVADGATKVEASATNGDIKINGTDVVVYTHPASHAASIITEDTTHRFATDNEKTAWNAMIPLSVVTTENDFIIATGSSVVARKTPGNVRTILNISDGANKVESSSTNGSIRIDGSEVAVYAHPSAKQCTYSYSHPTEKQCSYAYEHPLGKQCTYEYTHPTDKQCSYAYSHPSSKQCTGGDADTLDSHDSTYFATANHNHSGVYEPADTDIMKIDGAPTMSSILTAQNNTSYATKQVRNVTLSTSDPSGGGNGDIWIKY